jgi:septal ring factor EnvC (AmiA/AmiB activator)
MSDLTNRAKGIQTQVRKLIKERDEQRAKVAKLASQMHDENSMLEVLRKRIAELEHQNQVLKTAQSFRGASDPKESKERIDKLVKEIDTCISLLRT